MAAIELEMEIYTLTDATGTLATVPAGEEWLVYAASGRNDHADTAARLFLTATIGGKDWPCIPGTELEAGDGIQGVDKMYLKLTAGDTISGYSSDASVPLKVLAQIEKRSV